MDYFFLSHFGNDYISRDKYFWREFIRKFFSKSNGNFFLIIYIFSHFDFCHNRRNSFWTSWASLSFLRQTKHTFCHLKQTDNCTASFSSQLKKYWIGIFLDAKLHMYASKYNVHSGQKNCQLRKIIKSMAILFFTTIIVTIYNQGLQYTT